MLGLIGPNGSGKTTMLNLISGALKPSAGRDHARTATQISAVPANEIAIKGVARTFQIVRMLPSHDGARERDGRAASSATAGAGARELEDYAERPAARGSGLRRPARDTPVSALTYIDQKRVELARALASDPQGRCCSTSGSPVSIRPSCRPASR